MSGIGNGAYDGEAKKTAVVVRRGGVMPESFSSCTVQYAVQPNAQITDHRNTDKPS